MIPEQQSAQVKRWVYSRRSQRVVARIRVQVRREGDGDGLMSEVSHTLVVNAHGALIALAMSVQPGEKLIMKNLISGEEQGCRVVRLGEKQDEKLEVAIELAKPVPHFWHIDFPPSDWKALPE